MVRELVEIMNNLSVIDYFGSPGQVKLAGDRHFPLHLKRTSLIREGPSEYSNPCIRMC